MHNHHNNNRMNCYSCQPQQPQFIDVNVELVREREALRIQLAQLEEKYSIDIEELKVNLLDESERILTKEMTEQANYFEKLIYDKDTQLKQQNQQIQQLEHVNVEIKLENQQIKNKFQRKSEKVKFLKEELNQIKVLNDKRLADTEAYFKFKSEQELKLQEQDLHDRFQHEKIQHDNEVRRLKQLCAQFEEKYKQMLREIEQVRNVLQEKQRELDELHQKSRTSDQRSDLLQMKLKQQGGSQLSPTQPRYMDNQIEALQKELKRKDDKIKKYKLRLLEQPQVQTKYVQSPPQFIDRPVDRIVEVVRVVPVIQEKIVSQPQRQQIVVTYPEGQSNHNNNDEEVEELEEQLAQYTKKINALQNQIAVMRQDYEYVVDDRDELKRNLETMIRRVKEMEEQIRQKNRELNDKLQNLQGQRSPKEDKITVYVGKDKKEAQVRRQ